MVETKEGEITTLEVQVFGKPKPKTKWLHDDKEIRPSEVYDIQNFSDGTSILVIHEAQPEHIGKITFEAHNSVGVAETTTELVTEGNLSAKESLWFRLLFRKISVDKFWKVYRFSQQQCPFYTLPLPY